MQLLKTSLESEGKESENQEAQVIRREDDELRRLLWHLLGGTRGGENRARIIFEINTRPLNKNQLARRLGVHYRSVQHHLNVLTKNSLVVNTGEGYGSAFSIHPWLAGHFWMFEQIVGRLSFPTLKDTGQ